MLPTMFDGRTNHARAVLADVGGATACRCSAADPQVGALRRGPGGRALGADHRAQVQGRRGLPRGTQPAARPALSGPSASSSRNVEPQCARPSYSASDADHDLRAHRRLPVRTLRPGHRRAPRPAPRRHPIDIEFAGICHSDIHKVRDEWGGANFPMVPGHEIVGIVAAVGAEVTGTRSATASASAAWSTPAASASSARRPGAVLRQGAVGPTTRQGYDGDADHRRLLHAGRRRPRTSCSASPTARARRRRAAAVRRHHDVLAAAPLGPGRARSRAWSAWAASATWRVKIAAGAWAPRSPCFAST